MADFPQQLEELISRFDQNIEAYQSQVYNETQVRREFIDPFFEVLGWDVANKAGYAEGYKDVIHEDAIKIGGITKAPDYCFRIGGARKFFVEAKKPAVSITEDFDPGDKAGHDKSLTGVDGPLEAGENCRYRLRFGDRTNPRFLRTPVLSHCLTKVTLANFPRKSVKLCPALADILLYGRLRLNRIDSNHPNLIN
jgi:hypothetical protein